MEVGELGVGGAEVAGGLVFRGLVGGGDGLLGFLELGWGLLGSCVAVAVGFFTGYGVVGGEDELEDLEGIGILCRCPSDAEVVTWWDPDL